MKNILFLWTGEQEMEQQVAIDGASRDSLYNSSVAAAQFSTTIPAGWTSYTPIYIDKPAPANDWFAPIGYVATDSTSYSFSRCERRQASVTKPIAQKKNSSAQPASSVAPYSTRGCWCLHTRPVSRHFPPFFAPFFHIQQQSVHFTVGSQ